MSDFEREYHRIINELESEIANKKDLEIAKEKLYNIYNYIVKSDRSIDELLENQEKMKNDIDKLKKAVLDIEEDIYDKDFDLPYQEDKMHDNDYEFEITCPYCNYDFIADNSYINKVQIPCPKCKRIIDLDWSTADEYSNDLDSETKNTKYSAENENFETVNEDREKYRYNENSSKREIKQERNKTGANINNISTNYERKEHINNTSKSNNMASQNKTNSKNRKNSINGQNNPTNTRKSKKSRK